MPRQWSEVALNYEIGICRFRSARALSPSTVEKHPREIDSVSRCSMNRVRVHTKGLPTDSVRRFTQICLTSRPSPLSPLFPRLIAGYVILNFSATRRVKGKTNGDSIPGGTIGREIMTVNAGERITRCTKSPFNNYFVSVIYFFQSSIYFYCYIHPCKFSVLSRWLYNFRFSAVVFLKHQQPRCSCFKFNLKGFQFNFYDIIKEYYKSV